MCGYRCETECPIKNQRGVYHSQSNDFSLCSSPDTSPGACQDVEDLTKDDEEETLPVKRSKHFADRNVSAPKSARESATSNASKRKSPAKPAAVKPAKHSPGKKKVSKAEKSASKSRKAVIIESDDDDDDNFQARHAQLSFLHLYHPPKQPVHL